METPTHAGREIRTLGLGEGAPEFHGLLGVDGKRYSLSTFDGKRILVLVFSSNRCPTAKAYEDRMISIQREYEAHGVQLVAVNSNNFHFYSEERYPEMVRRAEEKAFNFPYLQDADQSLAKSYGAVCTLHAFVLDQGRTLRYRGRIDDSRDPSNVESHDLRNALEDLLADREVRVPNTVPFGCSLDYL